MTTRAVCEVHPAPYRHRPALASPLEFHHLRPRDWQRSLIDLDKSNPVTDTVAWLPSITPPTINGQPVTAKWGSAYGWVWDSTGVLAGRTCHGNVHAGIVALVHAWKPGDTPAIALSAVRRARPIPLLDAAEWSVAAMALTGWLAAGQTVEWLQQHGLWGQL